MIAAALGLAAIAGAGQAPVSALAFIPLAPSLEGSGGQVFLTLDEALELAFPKLEVERSTEFLSKEQKARVKKLSGYPVVSGIVYPYKATKEDPKTKEEVLVGTAYFETHRVRSLKETMMFVVSPDGVIVRAEVLAFYEPSDYMPNERYYAQFKGQILNDELRPNRGIKTVTGCTLTVNASTRAARRILAIHQVLGEPAPDPEEGDAKGSKE
ncbi:MAG: FMN-binding protein [Planctomycetes bacterium]|nr:FMN-binding protein [Planctomycetota bacterium]